MENEGQISRIAKVFGNGAHVFVPKEWAGEQIVVIKPKRKNIKEKIISILEPYLDSIMGVYLYGSYARGEQEYDSDIDLFIVSDKKIKIKVKGLEITYLNQESIGKAIKLEPLLIYSIFLEARPIINSKLIEELKERYKPRLSDFQEYLKDCQRIAKINEEFLKSENGDFLSSEAVIYSIMLRLRGLFIIRSILSGKKYSHKLFKSWIKKELPKIDLDSIYEAYRSSKNEKKVKQKIKITDIELLLEFLKDEIFTLKNG